MCPNVDCDEMYRNYWRLIYVICQGMLGSREDAEDATLETFYRACRSIDSYQPSKGSIKNFLIVIATRVCIDIWRRGPKTLETIDDGRQEIESLEQEAPDMAEQVIVRVALAVCLDQLTVMERAVLMLKCGMRQTWVKISGTLGITQSRARTLHRNALNKMRECLSETP